MSIDIRDGKVEPQNVLGPHSTGSGTVVAFQSFKWIWVQRDTIHELNHLLWETGSSNSWWTRSERKRIEWSHSLKGFL